MTEDLGPGFEVLPQDERRPRRAGRLLTAVTAAVVLAGGGVATYAAFAGDDPGADSPKAAVAAMIDDLSHSDLLGVVDDLAPGERDAIRGALTDDVAALKRLGVLSKSADPSSISGLSFTPHDLSYAAPVKITDSVQVVPIDGGSFDVSASLAKLPLTSRLLDLAKGAKQTTSQHQKITADEPLRIAAQQVGGRWYASVFYSVADQAADHKVPSAGDHIPAQGADSAESAVRTMLTDLTGGKVREAIALISPAELGALHDYGGLLADKASRGAKLPVSITSLDTKTAPVDGGTEVTITKLQATAMGQKLTVQVAGGCVKIASAFITKNLCGADIADTIAGFVTAMTCSSGFSHGVHSAPVADSGSGFASPGPDMRTNPDVSYEPLSSHRSCAAPTFTPAQKTALAHLFTGLLGAGVITTKVDGDWYVAPVRTLAHVGSSTLSALQGDDLFALASLGR